MSTKVPLSVMPDYYTSGLQDFLGDLGEIAASMNIVEMVTPINAGSEKKKFLEKALAGRPVNPSFQYNTELLGKVAGLYEPTREIMNRLKEVTAELSNEEPGRILAEMTAARCREIANLSVIAGRILNGRIEPASRLLYEIFDLPCQEVIEMAGTHAIELAKGMGVVRNDSPEREAKRRALEAMEFDAEKIREVFVWAAEQCGIAGSRPVEIDPLATAIDVRDKSSRGAVVVIPEARKVDGGKLVELTGHEICCHWGDSTRAGLVLPFLGSGDLKPSNEVLYEGYAVMVDYNTRLHLGKDATCYQSPWYILAIDLAVSGCDFREMAQALYRLVRPTTTSDKAAWNTVWGACYRVKRGSSGADREYVFMKDAAYFEGRILAEGLCKKGLSNVLEIATISPADLELLEPVVDFGEDSGHFDRIWTLQEKLCDKLLAEYA